MGSKWLTLAFVGSLGLIAWLCPAKSEVARAGDEDGSNVWPINAEERRRALELMRQATAELQANHLDAARRLAMQAAKLHATYSLFDVRPEHVLAEICPKMPPKKRPTFFFDLADPEKRDPRDIRKATELISRYQEFFDVYLGLNEKESFAVGDVLGYKGAQEGEVAVQAVA